MKLMRYIFYRVYTWQSGASGKDESPQFTAVIVISGLLATNIFGIINIFVSVYKEYHNYMLSIKYIIIYSICLVSINSYIYLYKSRYKKFREEFSDDKVNSKYRLYMWLYLLGTALFVYISGKISYYITH